MFNRMHERKINSCFIFIFCFFYQINAIAAQIHFHQTKETLSAITRIITKKEKGIYLRFGDGDLNIASGGEDSHQKATPQLAAEMQEALGINGENVLKCLPLYAKAYHGFEEGMFPGNHEADENICKLLINTASKYWQEEIVDVYGPCALAFSATQYEQDCLLFLKFLRDNSCRKILIGNRFISKYIRGSLFGDSALFIPTAEKNAGDSLDVVEQRADLLLNNEKGYTIIITCMGVSGRILQKRLYKKYDNVFLFDFGSLMDAICNMSKITPNTIERAWIPLSGFDATAFLIKLNEL